MNIGIILAGGQGMRFGSDLPKQFHKINGQEIISYSISAFKKSKLLNYFYIVGNSDEDNRRIEEKYQVRCILGGKSRNESIGHALEHIRSNHQECKNIFIHEAARPMITSEIIDLYIQELQKHDAVITTQHITDSLGSEFEWIVNRDNYYLVQAPEAFKFSLLYKYFNSSSPITATVQQLPSNIKVSKNFDFVNNLKVTYKSDLAIIEQLMRRENER